MEPTSNTSQVLTRNGETVVLQNAGAGRVRVGYLSRDQEETRVMQITGRGRDDWEKAKAVACLFYDDEMLGCIDECGEIGGRRHLAHDYCSADDVREIRQLLREVAQCE